MTRRVWDEESHSFIEVEVLYSGGRLPWAADDDRAWLGSGSLSDVRDKGHKRADLIQHREMVGKGLAGTSWRQPFLVPQIPHPGRKKRKVEIRRRRRAAA